MSRPSVSLKINRQWEIENLAQSIAYADNISAVLGQVKNDSPKFYGPILNAVIDYLARIGAETPLAKKNKREVRSMRLDFTQKGRHAVELGKYCVLTGDSAREICGNLHEALKQHPHFQSYISQGFLRGLQMESNDKEKNRGQIAYQLLTRLMERYQLPVGDMIPRKGLLSIGEDGLEDLMAK